MGQQEETKHVPVFQTLDGHREKNKTDERIGEETNSKTELTAMETHFHISTLPKLATKSTRFYRDKTL